MLLFFAFFIANFLRSVDPYSIGKREASATKAICQTKECVLTAALILEHMDDTVDPCEDFYKFTCGNFVKNTVLDEYEFRAAPIPDLTNELIKQLKTTVEVESPETSHQKAFQLTRTYYKACLNQTGIDASLKDLKDVIKKLGGWPVVDGETWNERNWDWTETIRKLRLHGLRVSYLIDFDVSIDDRQNSRRLVKLDMADDSDISVKYLVNGLDDPVVQAYYKLMVRMAEYFGADRTSAENEMLDALNFQISLAKISLPIEQRRNETLLYNLKTVKKLTDDYPYLSWRDYLNSILQPEVSVDNDDQVIVVDLGYFENLGKLLDGVSKRTLSNYLVWRAISDSKKQMNEEIRDIERGYNEVAQGTNAKTPKWIECLKEVKERLNLAVGALFVRAHFDKDSREKATDMMMRLKDSFQDMINEVDWMDDKTKVRAVEKLHSIFPHIAYPDEFYDDEQLSDYYRDLELVPDNYFEDRLRLRLFERAQDNKLLKEAVNKTEWFRHGSSAVVNAFYEPPENSIQIPAGIIQGIFFGSDRPNYLNYGALGYIMGHELTHGFDDQGRQYDKDGNLIDWWESETAERYNEKANCIIEQYGNQTAKEVGLNINGINTQGENIADNGGVKEAYRAYLRYERETGIEPALPGLPYTSQQMFWIAMGNSWCTKIRPEALRRSIITDEHSPGEFRVLVPVSNRPEFAEDFNCPSGSPMNPVQKCEVW